PTWMAAVNFMRHCELWKDPPPHPPPAQSSEPPAPESGPSLDYRFTSTRTVHDLAGVSIGATQRPAISGP
ncbi:MAG: hypothetical protein MUF22_08820, partial [Chitinispirillaceae bacterium]|nr:hypothetical protein [Chitinispirillaceae bacterium]